MIEVSPIKLQEFRFVGDGMYEARYSVNNRRSAIQSEFGGFLILDDQLYLICTVFGDELLMEVQTLASDFEPTIHINELYTTLMGFPLSSR